jgi:prephenate dehydratase
MVIRVASNSAALQALIENNPTGFCLALVPIENTYGGKISDTRASLEFYREKLKCIYISRLHIKYILTHRRNIPVESMTHIVTHEQAILQTKDTWDQYSLPKALIKI